MHESTYSVPEVHCSHCDAAIRAAVGRVAGVGSVTVDLERKVVSVVGQDVSDAAVRAAIDDAGFDVVP